MSNLKSLVAAWLICATIRPTYFVLAASEKVKSSSFVSDADATACAAAFLMSVGRATEIAVEALALVM